MNDSYGTLIAPDTLRLQRSLPGPIERVWQYLTESGPRSRWLARGEMDLRPGGEVELMFQHDQLSEEQVPTPERYRTDDGCHRQQGRILACEAPRLLSFTWREADGGDSEVRFDLAPEGDRVLLTITHSRLRSRGMLLSVSAGWHAHVGILVDRLEGREPRSFWPAHERLEAEYDRRLPRQAA
ncbi:SRPBCC family protein [Pseudoxanthomonas putridarboris]|uniref:SRPBCC family protein n=1 Tax=Pseudoxanthomonas putridarboris TaxID=752605 RepID=A0ABU9J0D8_9GAMM